MEIFAGTIAVWATIVGWLSIQRVLDRRRLVKFLDTGSRGEQTEHAAVFRLAARIFELPYSVDPVWISSKLSFLGASPGAVIAAGGCCSGKARLLIVCLAEQGIHAHQITLYHRKGHAQHCLVEIDLLDGRRLVDPSYGIYLTDSQGRALSLRDLQRGVVPVQVPLVTGRKCGYPPNEYHAFDYVASKTANWTRSGARRAAYSLLHKLSRGAVDRMVIPAWLEWPQNIAMAACTILLSAIGLFALLKLLA